MGLIKKLKCDGDCDEESDFEFDYPGALDYNYKKVLETGSEYQTYKNWVIEAYPDPEDPIAINFNYFCPSCDPQ